MGTTVLPAIVKFSSNSVAAFISSLAEQGGQNCPFKADAQTRTQPSWKGDAHGLSR